MSSAKAGRTHVTSGASRRTGRVERRARRPVAGRAGARGRCVRGRGERHAVAKVIAEDVGERMRPIPEGVTRRRGRRLAVGRGGGGVGVSRPDQPARARGPRPVGGHRQGHAGGGGQAEEVDEVGECMSDRAGVGDGWRRRAAAPAGQPPSGGGGAIARTSTTHIAAIRRWA